MYYDAVSRNECPDQCGAQPLHAGERGGPPGRQIADEADETGARLTEKPVTIAINEVADGRLDHICTDGLDLTVGA